MFGLQRWSGEWSHADHSPERFDLGYVVFVQEEYISNQFAPICLDIVTAFPGIGPLLSRYVMALGQDHDYIGITNFRKDGIPGQTRFFVEKFTKTPTFNEATRWRKDQPIIRGKITIMLAMPKSANV